VSVEIDVPSTLTVARSRTYCVALFDTFPVTMPVAAGCARKSGAMKTARAKTPAKRDSLTNAKCRRAVVAPT
jgi:hypothetical protein